MSWDGFVWLLNKLRALTNELKLKLEDIDDEMKFKEILDQLELDLEAIIQALEEAGSGGGKSYVSKTEPVGDINDGSTWFVVYGDGSGSSGNSGIGG